MGKRHRRQVEGFDQVDNKNAVPPAKKTRVTKNEKPVAKGRKVQDPKDARSKRRDTKDASIREQPKEISKNAQAGEVTKQSDGGHSYWLMKAEPESRIEKGKDVKFSIDDLAAATEPEGWDGVRNFVARNNMRAMRKGDLAFFYHSNCKIPGIAGTMEIVKEHSPDKNALDPNHPYYDPKDSAENPKWSLVHVEHRWTFPRLISLKELQKYRSPGGKLENMQTMKQSRLSVSKVSEEEWKFILSLLDSEQEQ